MIRSVFESDLCKIRDGIANEDYRGVCHALGICIENRIDSGGFDEPVDAEFATVSELKELKNALVSCAKKSLIGDDEFDRYTEVLNQALTSKGSPPSPEPSDDEPEDEFDRNLRRYKEHRSKKRKYFKVETKDDGHPESKHGHFWLSDEDAKRVRTSTWNRSIKPAKICNADFKPTFTIKEVDALIDSGKEVLITNV